VCKKVLNSIDIAREDREIFCPWFLKICVSLRQSAVKNFVWFACPERQPKGVFRGKKNILKIPWPS